MQEIINEEYYISHINIIKDNKSIYLNVSQINKSNKHERQVIIGFNNIEEAKKFYNEVSFIKNYQQNYMKGEDENERNNVK